MERGDSYGRIGGGIAWPKRDRNSTGRPTESRNLGLWSSESEPPTKEHTWDGPRPLCTYVADMYLGLHVGPEQLEQGLTQKVLPVHRIWSSSWAALSLGEKAPTLADT